jgi:hypothetical protein
MGVIRLKDSRRRFFLSTTSCISCLENGVLLCLRLFCISYCDNVGLLCRRGLWNLFELIFARAFSTNEYSGQTWLNRSFCDDGVILRTRLFSISSLLLSYRDSFSFHIYNQLYINKCEFFICIDFMYFQIIYTANIKLILAFNSGYFRFYERFGCVKLTRRN